MNNQETYRLTDLIRLLDHALVPERDVILRERLTDDSELRHRLKRLQNTMTVGLPLDDFESKLLETDETLSAYLDGQLTNETAREFEETALANPSLLWELISADRFARSDTHSSPITPKSTHRAMQAVVARSIKTDQRDTVDGENSRNLLNGQPLVAKAVEMAIDSELPSDDSQKARPKKLNPKKDIKFFVTACLAVAAIMGAIWLGIQNGPEKTDLVDSESERNGTLDGSQIPSLPPKVKDSVVLDEPPPLPNKEIPDSVTPQMPAPEIAATNNTEDKTPPVPPPEPARIIPVEWKRTTGLVVERIDQNHPWKPVLVFSDLQNETENRGIEYRSLQESWGEAYAGASRVVIGPKTATRLLITQAKQTRFTINKMNGQLAITSLPKQSEILISLNGREKTLTVVEPDTSIAFDSDLAEGDLIVLQGAISLHENRIDAAHKISLTEIRYSGPEPFRQVPRWIAASPQSQAIVRTTAEAFSEESNVLAALLKQNSELNDRQAMIAAEWSFELEPTLAVSRAAISKNEVQREAAIGWLLSSNGSIQDQRVVWQQISSHISASPLPVADWYLSMRKQSQVTPELLRELALGISPKQPLFVRQTSIHMLRSISGQPFQTYNPARPSPRSISAVRASVRKMLTRVSKSPQRKSPQRRTDRGS